MIANVVCCADWAQRFRFIEVHCHQFIFRIIIIYFIPPASSIAPMHLLFAQNQMIICLCFYRNDCCRIVSTIESMDDNMTQWMNENERKMSKSYTHTVSQVANIWYKLNSKNSSLIIFRSFNWIVPVQWFCAFREHLVGVHFFYVFLTVIFFFYLVKCCCVCEYFCPLFIIFT